MINVNEQYNFQLSGMTMIFLDINDEEKLVIVKNKLIDMGASSSTDRIFVIKSNSYDGELLLRELALMGVGDCIALVSSDEQDKAVCKFIAAPNNIDGISVDGTLKRDRRGNKAE